MIAELLQDFEDELMTTHFNDEAHFNGEIREMIYTKDRTEIILDHGKYKGVEYAIISYGTHPCAYVRMPLFHPFFNYEFEYDIPIICHGGITYARSSYDVITRRGSSVKGFIGWDYAHAGDYHGYCTTFEDAKWWTTFEIFNHVKDVINQILEYNNKNHIKLIHRGTLDIAVNSKHRPCLEKEYYEELLNENHNVVKPNLIYTI